MHLYLYFIKGSSLLWCPAPESNRYGQLRPADFKSAHQLHSFRYQYYYCLAAGLSLHLQLHLLRWVIIVSARYYLSIGFAQDWHQHYLLSFP